MRKIGGFLEIKISKYYILGASTGETKRFRN